MSEVTQEQMDRLWKTVNAVSERTLRVETLVETSLASREWVKDELSQIKEAMAEMASQLKELGASQLAINNQQSEMMKQRAEYEREKREAEREKHQAEMKALESQTWLKVITDKWSPLADFIVKVSVVGGIAGALMTYWIRSQPAPEPVTKPVPTHVATQNPRR